jgi:hypothetical protein
MMQAGDALDRFRETRRAHRGILVFGLFVAIAAAPHVSRAARGDCAQPITDGSAPVATDALYLLETSIGLHFCKRCICDVDGSGATTASDALFTLKAAVGVPVALACESCGDPVPLYCELDNYPCSLADSDPDALDRTFELLEALHAVRDNGTMDDVRDYLEAQPDVVSVGGDSQGLRFRVDGAAPAFFTEATPLSAESQAPLRSNARTSAPSPPAARAVVGEDRSGDGKTDNRDYKKALVLAAYEWQWRPYDVSEQIATILGNIRPYQGRVTFKRNAVEPAVGQDGAITLHDFLNFQDYDMIYVATHGVRMCWLPFDGGDPRCGVVIDSGTVRTPGSEDLPLFGVPGMLPLSRWGESSDAPSGTYQVGLSHDFWQYWYNGRLDNALVAFMSCETGGPLGSELAEAMGNERFAMTGWSEIVNVGQAFQAYTVFFEALFEGRTVLDGLEDVEDAGLSPYVNTRGDVSSLQVFTPSVDDLRIFEIPRLMYEGQEMYDGADVTPFVTGTLGDPTSDSLTLTLQIDGVTPETQNDFSVRYRVDDMDTTGTYDLASAMPVTSGATTYEVEHDVDLGFGLTGGEFPIEVIVDLPEGGDSRFSVDATAAPCSIDATLSGEALGSWDGPAQLVINGDGRIDINLWSRGWVNGDLASTMTGGASAPPGTPLAPGTYDLSEAAVSVFEPLYNAIYLNSAYHQDVEDFDCGGCGGSITFDSLTAEKATGSFTAVLPQLDMNDMPYASTTFTVQFTALPGSTLNGSSPITQCRAVYGED